MAYLSANFQKAFPPILTRIIQDLGHLLDLEMEADLAEPTADPLDPLFQSMASGVVCCRALFTRKINGVGGFLVDAQTAKTMAYAAMKMQAPEGPFQFDAVIQEAWVTIFEVFLRSWNSVSESEWILGTKSGERSVEFYSTELGFPSSAGVIPVVCVTPVKVGGLETRFVTLLPAKAVRGLQGKGFAVPNNFVTTTAVSSPGSASQATPLPVTPAPQARAKPVVILDYTGSVVEWVKSRSEDPEFQCLLSDSTDPRSSAGGDPPSATVLVGFPQELLRELSHFSFIEIHKRK